MKYKERKAMKKNSHTLRTKNLRNKRMSKDSFDVVCHIYIYIYIYIYI